MVDPSLTALAELGGYFTLDGVRRDALVLEAVDFGPTRRPFELVVPYRPKREGQSIAVHRPKFTRFEGEAAPLAEASFRGVDRHEKAALVWSEHLDESV